MQKKLSPWCKKAKIAMIQNDISVNDLAEELGCSRCYLSSTLNTTVGPTSFKFGDRAKLWQEEYEKLKKDLKLASVSPSAILMNAGDMSKQPTPYFYNGMMSHEESEGDDI